MLQNNHVFRGVLYIVAVLAQPIAFFVAAGDPGGLWADATEKTAQFLAAMAGITAFGNLTPSSSKQLMSDNKTL